MVLTAEEKLGLLYRGDELPAPVESDIAEQGVVPTPDKLYHPLSALRPATDAAINYQSLPARTKLASESMEDRDESDKEIADEGVHDSDIEDDYIAACMAKASQPSRSEGNSTVGAPRKKKQNHTIAASGPYDVPKSSGQAGQHTKYTYDHPVQEHDESGNLLVSKFCSLALVVVFPYKFIAKKDSDRVAKRFFDGGKIWNKPWNMYYIHPPHDLEAKPLLLVAFQQVQDLIDQINTHYNSKLVVPTNPELGFTIPFYDDETPQPIYLGRTKSREHISEMADTIPDPSKRYGEPPAGANSKVDRSFAAFKKKMEAAAEAAKKKNKAFKQRRTQDRLQQQQEWCNSMKRGQRYLGLRPRNLSKSTITENAGGSWEEQQAFERETAIAGGLEMKPLDLDQKAQYVFDYQPIIIAIDLEWNERNHKQVTELGISTLDTMDLEGIAPGEGGENWRGHIRSRHFRISEMSYHVNKDFCPGNPAAFLFGTSEFVPIADAHLAFDICFQWPYSAQFKNSALRGCTNDSGVEAVSQSAPDNVQANPAVSDTKHSANDDALRTSTVETRSDLTESPTDEVFFKGRVNQDKDKSEPSCPSESATTGPESVVQKGPKERKIVLIGHDLTSDITSLRLIRSAVLDAGKSGPNGKPIYNTILESLDTSIMHRVLIRDSTAESLGNILLELGITGWQLHNAGNDARYTLEAFIALAIKDRLTSDKRKFASETDQNNVDEAWNAEVQNRINQKIQAVEEQVQAEAAVWEAAVTGRQHIDTSAIALGPGMERTSSTTKEAPLHSGPSVTETSSTWLPNTTTFGNSEPNNLHDGGDPRGLDIPAPENLSWGQAKPKKKKKTEAAKQYELHEQYLQYMREQKKNIETTGLDDIDQMDSSQRTNKVQ